MQKKRVGRPKKSPIISTDKFKGIGTPSNPIVPTQYGIVEWTYTEIKTFNNVMKTLKSCEVEMMKLSFCKNRIIIEGITNQYAKTPKVERKTRLTIDATDTFSYYLKEPIKFTINMSEWNTSLEDMDESCNKFTIIYRSGDELSVQIKNASVVCKITNRIKIEKVDSAEFFKDNIIKKSIDNHECRIVNVKTNTMKTFLGKNSRKTAQETTFQLNKKHCQFEFKLSSEKIQTVSLNVSTEKEYEDKRLVKKSKEQFFVISRTDGMYDIKFPSAEIHKFLLHMKNDIVELYLGDDSVVVRVLKPRVVYSSELTEKEIAKLPPHSSFSYYIPLTLNRL